MAEAQVLNTADTVARVRGYLEGLQARITDALEAVEGEGGARFLADAWSKPPGEPLQGDGITKIMEGGRCLSVRAVASATCVAHSCRLRPRSTGLSWQARRLRPWAFRWCSTRATPTFLRCT